MQDFLPRRARAAIVHGLQDIRDNNAVSPQKRGLPTCCESKTTMTRQTHKKHILVIPEDESSRAEAVRNHESRCLVRSEHACNFITRVPHGYNCTIVAEKHRTERERECITHAEG